MNKWDLIEQKVSDLKEYDLNPRILSDEKLDNLQQSITKFGICEPIVINTDFTICGGHGRLTILKRLGIQYVDCYVPSKTLTESQFKELNVRLNKNTAGDFDFEILHKSFKINELQDIGFSLDEMQLDPKLQIKAEFDMTDDTHEDEEKFSEKIIQYAIIFDNEKQQGRWYDFLLKLKLDYPDLNTHAERLDLFIGEQNEK
tara:strand:- start:15324 stop:15926 length:603 start_codon:yes stop_codon:yes gene_type:complete